MNRIKLFLAASVMLALLFAVNMQAQRTAWVTNNDAATGPGYKTIDFVGYVSGTDTLISSEFQIGSYNYVMTGFKLLDQTNDSVKITIKRFVKGISWFSDKTIATSDSVLTENTFADTTSGQWNKLYLIGTTGNGYKTLVKVRYELRK